MPETGPKKRKSGKSRKHLVAGSIEVDPAGRAFRYRDMAQDAGASAVDDGNGEMDDVDADEGDESAAEDDDGEDDDEEED